MNYYIRVTTPEGQIVGSSHDLSHRQLEDTAELLRLCALGECILRLDTDAGFVVFGAELAKRSLFAVVKDRT